MSNLICREVHTPPKKRSFVGHASRRVAEGIAVGLGASIGLVKILADLQLPLAGGQLPLVIGAAYGLYHGFPSNQHIYSSPEEFLQDDTPPLDVVIEHCQIHSIRSALIGSNKLPGVAIGVLGLQMYQVGNRNFSYADVFGNLCRIEGVVSVIESGPVISVEKISLMREIKFIRGGNSEYNTT